MPRSNAKKGERVPDTICHFEKLRPYSLDYDKLWKGCTSKECGELYSLHESFFFFKTEREQVSRAREGQRERE